MADAVVSYIKPIQEKIWYLLSDQQYLLEVLREGNRRAAEISEKNMEDVRYKLGLKFKVKRKDKFKVNLS